MKVRPVILIPLLLTAVVLISALYYLPRATGYLDEKTHAVISGKAGEWLNGDVTVGKVRWHLLPLGLTLEDLRLRPPEGSGVERLELSGVSVRLQPLRLLRGDAAVSRISVQGYSIGVVLKELSRAGAEELGRSVFKEGEPGPGRGKASTFFIPSQIELIRGDIALQLPANNLSARLDGANIVVRPRRGVGLKLKAPRAAITYGGTSKEIAGLKVALTVKDGLVEIERLSGVVDGVSLDVSGKARSGENGLALKVKSSGPADAYGGLLGEKLPLKGEMSIVTDIGGSWQGPTLTGTLKSPHLTAFSTEVGNFEAAFKYEGGSLEYNGLKAKLLGGRIEGNGTIDFRGDGPVKLKASNKLSGISLSEVERRAGRSLPIKGEIKGGAVLIDAEMGSGRPWKIRTEIEAALDPFLISPPFGKTPPPGNPSKDGAWLTLGPTTLSGDLTFSDDDFSITRLDLRSGVIKVAVNGRYAHSGALDLSYSVEIPDLLTLKMVHRQDLRGNAEANGNIAWAKPKDSGGRDSWVLKSDFKIKGTVFRGLPLGEARGRVTYDGGTLSLADIHVVGPRLRAEAQGVLNLSGDFSGRLDGRTSADSVSAILKDLKGVSPEIGGVGERLDGVLRTDWSAVWEKGFSLAIDMQLTEAKYEGERFNMTAPLRLDGEKVEIRGGRADYGGGAIGVRGYVDYEGGMRLTISGAGIDLQKVKLIKAPVGGLVGFRAELGGTVGGPRVRGSGRVEGLSYSNTGLPFTIFSFDYDGKAVSVKGSDYEGTLSVDGKFSTSGNKKYLLTYRFNDLSLDPFLSWLPEAYRISGWMSGTGKTVGQEGEGPSTYVSVDRLNLVGEGLSWWNRSPLALAMEGGRVRIQPFEMEGDGSRFKIWGEVTQGGDLDLQMRGKVNLALIDYLKPGLKGLSGAADARIQVRGPAKNPAIQGEVESVGLTYKHPSMTYPLKFDRIYVRFDGERANIEELRAKYGKGDIKGRGFLAIKGGAESLQLEMTFNNLSDRFTPPGTDSSLEATVSGDASLKGDYRKRESIAGEVHLASASFSVDTVAVTLKERVRIKVEKGVVSFPSMKFTSEVGDFTLAGSVSSSGGLDLAVGGRLLVEPLLRASRQGPDDIFQSVEGFIDYSLLIGGRVGEPELGGRAALSLDTVLIRGFDPPITGLRGTLLFEPHQVRLVDIKGKLGGGTVVSSGTVALSGLSAKSAEVSVKFKDAAIEYVGKFTATVSGDMAYVLREKKGLLKGHATVNRALYYGDINWKETVAKQGARLTVKSEPARDKKPLALFIDIEFENPMSVANNIMEAKVDGNLGVRGNTREPELYGSVAFSEGSVFFGDRVYTINNGVVDFSGPLPKSISFDTSLTTIVRKYTLTILLSGSPTSYTLQFSSDPPLEQADILSLLALGTTVADLNRKGARETSAADALKIFAYVVQSRLAHTLRQTTGLDVVEIDTMGEPGAEASKIRVGKKVTESLSVVYSAAFQQGSKQDVELVYKLTNKVYLRGLVTDVGGTEVGLVYRLEFK